MGKYKSEIDMFGVKLNPHYAKKQYTVVDHAKREIRSVQKLHRSYNVPARILVYLQHEESSDWTLVDEVDVDISAS